MQADRPAHRADAVARADDPRRRRDARGHASACSRPGRPARWIDRSLMVFSVLGFSVPVFVVGYMLIYVFAIKLRWLPVQGYAPIAEGFGPWIERLDPALDRARPRLYGADRAHHPRRHARRAGRGLHPHRASAKGVATRPMLLKHALKNAGVPIVTVIGIGVALLIGGVVITETVFNIPGVGRLVVDAISQRDYPIIQGVILLVLRRLRAGEPAWSTSATRCSIRGSAIDGDRRHRSAGCGARAGAPARHACAASSAATRRCCRRRDPQPDRAARRRGAARRRRRAHHAAGAAAARRPRRRTGSAPTISAATSIARTVYGARVSLFVGLSVAAFSVVARPRDRAARPAISAASTRSSCG